VASAKDNFLFYGFCLDGLSFGAPNNNLLCDLHFFARGFWGLDNITHGPSYFLPY
tara:strand:+ start:348 stop:512 length:165 start_codon:yes stop_codon:yes gene_type:complete